MPPGSVAGASVTAIGAAIATLYARVPAAPLLSVARSVKLLLLPAVVGVPARTPAEVSVRPAGSAPEISV